MERQIYLKSPLRWSIYIKRHTAPYYAVCQGNEEFREWEQAKTKNKGLNEEKQNKDLLSYLARSKRQMLLKRKKIRNTLRDETCDLEVYPRNLGAWDCIGCTLSIHVYIGTATPCARMCNKPKEKYSMNASRGHREDLRASHRMGGCCYVEPPAQLCSLPEHAHCEWLVLWGAYCSI